MKTIGVQLLHDNAKVPVMNTPGAAGYDLYAVEPATVFSGAQVVIPTGVAVALPEGYYGRIAPRSGLAVRHGINVHAGVIDNDYRGEIHICLINHGEYSLDIYPGDRIAQMVVERYCHDAMLVVKPLDTTVRGARGFGSTGV